MKSNWKSPDEAMKLYCRVASGPMGPFCAADKCGHWYWMEDWNCVTGPCPPEYKDKISCVGCPQGFAPGELGRRGLVR